MLVIKKFLSNKVSLVVVATISYIALLFYADIESLSHASTEVDYQYIPIIIGPMIIAILLLGYRFHIILKKLNINSSAKRSLTIYIAGLSFLATPANSGQIVKSHIMKEQFGIEISRTAPILLIEKWSELCSTVIFLIFLALFYITWESMVVTLTGIVLSIFIFGVMRNQEIFRLFKRLISKFSFLKKYEESIENSRDTLKILSSKKIIAAVIVTTLPAIILMAVSVYFMFEALGIHISFVMSSEIFYISLIFGGLTFIPGGLGITEASMLGLLVKYTNYELVVLTTAVLLVRLVTLWFPTILGLITYRASKNFK
jgi:glycosyltransferase 2 family protein